MNTPVLNDNLRAATEALCNLLAKEDQVVASKAKIGLFFQNPEATKLFEEVNAYGEELRNKHLAGMPPTEEEISKFDTLRENVVKNDAARGFLEARQTIDELLNTINHYLGMSIDLGRAPTPEEIEEARQRAMSAQTSCSCGGSCDKESCDCDGNCDHDHDHKDGGCGCGEGHAEGHSGKENRQGLHKPLRQPEKLSASEPISKIAAHDRIFSQMPQKPAAFHKGFFKRGPHLHAACIFPTPLSSSGRARRLNGRWAHVSLILRNHDFFQPPSFRFPAVYQNGFPVVPGSDGRSNGPHFPHHLQGTGG